MTDLIHQGFLQSAEADAKAIGRESDCMQLSPDPNSGDPPHTYLGLLKGAEHYVRGPDGTFVVRRRPLSFTIHFPEDYLRSLDPNLQFRVVATSRHLVHPNVSGGVVCLGAKACDLEVEQVSLGHQQLGYAGTSGLEASGYRPVGRLRLWHERAA